MTRQTGAVLGMLFLAHAAAAQFTQQGNKLVGTGAVGPAMQGDSVAISADGSTAIVGGPRDNSGSGAAWVFTRAAGAWNQQGVKLLGTDSVFPAAQGQSVAISADGNTAIVGGPGDNANAGAAWVFTRTQGVWSQQGGKLVGSGAVGTPRQGYSVAISADGNTAIVGGPNDDSGSGGSGAAWVFTRNGAVWSQQGSKLVATGAGWPSGGQGASVAISADGNTAIVGAPGLSSYGGGGAMWVYTRAGGVWSQQGGALYGTDPPGGQGSRWFFGDSVAVSADGNTAIVGGRSGSCDDCIYGPAWWVFTRSGEVWSQQWSALGGDQVAISGNELIALVGLVVYTRSGGVWSPEGSTLAGTGEVGMSFQGSSVAISADGSTAIVGGPGDDSWVGAAWVFASSGCAAPSIYAQPQSQGFQSAQVATLSVAATGSMPLAYQWYQGSSGDTSSPVGTHSSSFTTPTLTGTTSYWVRVSNSCGHADSATATVWIGCIPPLITTQPQNQSIHTGQTATLSVTASGAPLSYQWYQGDKSDTSHPVGTDSSTLTTPPLTTTTSFWVWVSNACGHDDSGAAVVLVGPAYAYFTWVPVASHNGGLNRSQWRSNLGLLNPGMVQANVQISFFGGGGVVSNTAYVSPGVQSIFTDVVGQVGGSGSGALEILSDQPVKVTARSYNQVASDASCYAGGTQGQDYPALLTGDGLAATQSAYLAGLSEDVSSHCNIGVVNTGAASATVLVELLDGAGVKLTDYPVTLNPGDWKQETQPFLKKAGQTAMDRGYARVTVQSGSGVFAFASVIDNITNDPTTVTMQR